MKRSTALYIAFALVLYFSLITFVLAERWHQILVEPVPSPTPLATFVPSLPPCPSKAPKQGITAYVNCQGE